MQFEKDRFSFDGEYLLYNVGGEFDSSHFVARFKRNKSDRTGFINFLIKNFTVAEYFHKLTVENVAPYKILEDEGYMSASLKRNLKLVGYEPTLAGKRKYIDDQLAKYY